MHWLLDFDRRVNERNSLTGRVVPVSNIWGNVLREMNDDGIDAVVCFRFKGDFVSVFALFFVVF